VAAGELVTPSMAERGAYAEATSMKRSNSTVGVLTRARIRLRPAFVITFSLLGLAGVAALVVAMSWIVGKDIRGDQLTSARQAAQLLAQSSFAPRLDRRPGRVGRLDANTIHQLDVAAVAARRIRSLSSVVVRDRRGRVLYSTNHRQIDRRYRLTPTLKSALAGHTLTTTRSQTGAGKRVEIVVPMYRRGSDAPAAAFVVNFPYAPIATAVRSRTWRIELILIGAALMFYAAIWPRLLAASRAFKSQHDPRREILLAELGLALETGQLELVHQPMVELSSGRVSSVESLVRWRHPKRGMLTPDQFLPAAAGSDLIGPLTLQVLDLALRDCRRWREAGVEAGVCVNLSEANVLDERLPNEVGRLLGHWRVPPTALCLEVTEKAIASAPEHAAEILDGLDDMGVRISIDDFGTGYSSLAGLRDLPVSELKIDRSFVSGLQTVQSDEAIVRAVIGLAHQLGVQVIAEGVEDDGTLRRLAQLGCDQAQGYYFTRPLPLEELLEWFAGADTSGPAHAGRPAALVA
jgi:EAL domain-containing protein (putative c-di-GMP-specific phosphodiesterase class I)